MYRSIITVVNPITSALAAGCLLGLFLSSSAIAQVNVLTYRNDTTRTGQNLNETTLTPANVNTNTFGKLFSYTVDADIYAQPLYVSGLAIPGKGSHDVVFIATEHNTVYAFDADSTNGLSGGLLWQTNLGPYAVTPNPDFGNRYHNGMYQDIAPAVGITGTPVIDRASGTLYVDAFTHEGSSYFHRIHALSITNGAEQPYSPVLIQATYPGTGVGGTNGVLTFTPSQQLQRSALTLAGGKLYVCYTGYADTDPYHGWIFCFDPTTLQQLPNYLFVTTPNATTNVFGTNAGEGGIWMGGGGLCVDANTNLYVETANGSFSATNNSSGKDFSDSFIRFSTTNGLAVADYFTPYNQASLASGDTDLGSGACILLPDQSGPVTHLMLGAGKQGKIYLINRDQMTTGNNHYDPSTSSDHVVQTVSAIKASFGTPAYFNGRVYYAGNGDNLKAFSLTSGALSTSAVSTSTNTFAFPGTSPIVSANGTSNGIVWTLANASPALLVAYNPTNLTNQLYNSSQAGTRDQPANGVKFTLPMVANGKVYVGTHAALTVYGLFAGTLAFSSPTYSAARDGGTATITVNRIGTNGAVQLSYATAAGGTAVNGVDYIGTSGVLNWANGDNAAKSFNINILQPNQAESNLTVNLALSAPGGGATLGGQSTAVLTIMEDSYDVWRFAHFGTSAANSAVSGDLADPDGDGVVNLLEYALASNPIVPNTNNWPAAALAGGHFQIHFSRNTSATNLTYIVESSSSLTTWTPVMTYTASTGWVTNSGGASASESAPSGVPPDQYVNVTIDLQVPAASSQYLRLRVHR